MSGLPWGWSDVVLFTTVSGLLSRGPWSGGGWGSTIRPRGRLLFYNCSHVISDF